MSRTKNIIIDSGHAIDGGLNPNNFKVNINNAEYMNNIKKISLIGLRTMNSHDNVNENNNVIDYTYGVDKQIVIGEGQYNVTDYMTSVNAAQADFVISLNALSFRFEFTSAGLPLTIKKNNISNEVLGITEDLIDALGGVTIMSPFVPDLTGLSMLYISSQALGHGNSILSNSETGNIISSVPIKAQYGFAITYESDTRDDTDNHSFFTSQSLHTIDIQLLTHNFKEAKLKSFVHLVFKIYY